VFLLGHGIYTVRMLCTMLLHQLSRRDLDNYHYHCHCSNSFLLLASATDHTSPLVQARIIAQARWAENAFNGPFTVSKQLWCRLFHLAGGWVDIIGFKRHARVPDRERAEREFSSNWTAFTIVEWHEIPSHLFRDYAIMLLNTELFLTQMVSPLARNRLV